MDVSVIESYKVHVVRPKVQLTVSGVGGFGKVCGITCNGAPCVAKGLRRLLMETPSEAVSGDQSASLFTQLLKECVLHSKLRHPNIVQFIGVEYGNDPSKYDLLLVTERIDTDLTTCLRAYPNIPLTIKLSVLRDVSAGLLYLHSFNPPIIHGDLTTTNILLTHDWRAKIADFGNSVDQSLSVLHIAADALPYMPPEAIAIPLHYDSKLDIFSFGTVALYVGVQTGDADRNKKAEQIRSLEAVSDLQCLYKIVKWCCDKDPVNRPSACELNDHLQTLYVEPPLSYANMGNHQLVETATLHQTIGTLETNKAMAESKINEVQRELEDVKKVKNKEMNRLKAEIEDLKLKLEHEMAEENALHRTEVELHQVNRVDPTPTIHDQSISHKLDYENEREDRIKAIERIEEMKKQGATVSGNFLSKQFWGKEQHLKDCQLKIEDMNGELLSLKKASETLKEIIRHHIQTESADKAKISSLEEELRAVKKENETLSTPLLQAESAGKDNFRISPLEEELRAVKKENEMLSNEVDAFKASLIKSGEASASHPETQVTIANAERANSLLKEQNEALNHKLEVERAKYERELSDLKEQLRSVKENLNAMEILMQQQLKDLNAQLNEAKEEIAVKVAQVKQYQKQVEAYKQQAHAFSQSIPSSTGQLSSESSADHTHVEPHATPPVQMAALENPCVQVMPPPASSDHPVPLLTGNPMMLANDENSSKHSTERVPAPSCDPAGGSEVDAGEDLPPPIFLNAFHFQGPSQPDAAAQKNSHHSNMETSRPLQTPVRLQPQLPHCETVPMVPRGAHDDFLSGERSRSYSDRNDSYHMQQNGPVAVQGRYGSAEVLLPPGQRSNYNATPAPSKPYSEQMQKSTDLAEGIDDDISAMVRGRMDVDVTAECAPLDPNLKCPFCGTMFKKGEIQKFKCHAEACTR